MITRKEINDKLTSVYQQIGKEPAEKLHKKLEEIFQYKPVDNYYTFVKASLYLYEGKIDKVWATLYGKENWYFPGPYANLLAKVQYETSVASKHPYEGKIHKILAYYAYVAGQERGHGASSNLCDEEFIKEAQECYEAEIAYESALIEKSLTEWDYLDNEGKSKCLEGLIGTEYNLINSVMGLLCLCIKNEFKISEQSQHEYFWNEVEISEPNFGYIWQQIKEKSDSVLILRDEFLDKNHTLFLEKFLKEIGKKVVVLSWEASVEEENLKKLEAMLKENRYYDVFASQVMFRHLQGTYFKNRVECLSTYRGEAQVDRISFGYLGSYTEYVSRIYGYDYQKALESPNKCMFSIVIPARNSAYTLKYTLQTVLNQTEIETDEFEVIISDNSTNGNSEIKRMIEEINDNHIVYIKTPVDLPLQKSFEFAYGKARGVYIIPLGSDDGMLPWALKVLKEIIIKYPKENVIGWERGFFQWSESNSNQRGKFVIPRSYKKGIYKDSLKKGKQTLKEQIAMNGSGIYAIPIFYINTAFKRSYIKEMCEKSGAILDGYTQDISMSIKSLLLNEHYVFMEYPLTIAGMSDSSLGAAMGKGADTDAEMMKNLKNETPRGFGQSGPKTEMPFHVIASTEGLFWSELFRNYTEKVFSENLRELICNHDFSQTFLILTSCKSRNALEYMPLLEKLYYNAWSLDDELGKWYEEILYVVATQKLYLEQKENSEGIESYATGFNESGGLVLDARKFSVNTIQEAVELFQIITNL